MRQTVQHSDTNLKALIRVVFATNARRMRALLLQKNRWSGVAAAESVICHMRVTLLLLQLHAKFLSHSAAYFCT
jgi:hypothetical protein